MLPPPLPFGMGAETVTPLQMSAREQLIRTRWCESVSPTRSPSPTGAVLRALLPDAEPKRKVMFQQPLVSPRSSATAAPTHAPLAEVLAPLPTEIPAMATAATSPEPSPSSGSSTDTLVTACTANASPRKYQWSHQVSSDAEQSERELPVAEITPSGGTAAPEGEQSKPERITAEAALDTAAEAVAAAMAAAPKAAKVATTAGGKRKVVRLAVNVDLELEAALASSRNRDEVEVAPLPSPKSRLGALEKSPSSPAMEQVVGDSGEPKKKTWAEMVKQSVTPKKPAAAGGRGLRGSEAAAPRRATPVTIMDIEDVSFWAELCTRSGAHTSEDVVPGRPRDGGTGKWSGRQPAPARKGQGPNCSSCPMAPLDVPCGTQSKNTPGVGCAATKAASSVARGRVGSAPTGGGQAGCHTGDASSCVMCGPEAESCREPCAACNCGLRVFTRNTFLTVEDEERVGSSKRSLSL